MENVILPEQGSDYVVDKRAELEAEREARREKHIQDYKNVVASAKRNAEIGRAFDKDAILRATPRLNEYSEKIFEETLQWDKDKKDALSYEEELVRKLGITRNTQDREILLDELKRLRDVADWKTRNEAIITPEGGVVRRKNYGEWDVVLPNQVSGGGAGGAGMTVLKPGEMGVDAFGNKIYNDKVTPTVVGKGERAFTADGRVLEGYVDPTVMDSDKVFVNRDGSMGYGPQANIVVLGEGEQALNVNSKEIVGQNNPRVFAGSGQNFVLNPETGNYEVAPSYTSNGNGIVYDKSTGQEAENKQAMEVVRMQNANEAKGGSGDRYQKLGNGLYYDKITNSTVSVGVMQETLSKQIVGLKSQLALIASSTDSASQKLAESYKIQIAAMEQMLAELEKAAENKLNGVPVQNNSASSGQSATTGIVYVPKGK
jgi:hypothetical protein